MAGASILTRTRGMIRAIYDWTLSLARHRRATWGLAGVSFIESSVFPIPPDLILIPMVIARPDRAWVYAGVCTIASALGGLLGYAIGYFLYESAGLAILEFYGYTQKFEEFAAAYNEWGAWIVFGAGLTPFPYKVITIASGVTQMDVAIFVLASVIGRGLRFFAVAGLLRYFGAPIQAFIEKRLGLLTILFFVLLFGGFVLVRYVF